MTVRYGGKCVDCCIPAGEATLDFIEELEWSDEDVIVERSREPSEQRSESMQTDEPEKRGEPSTTCRGEGTPKRGDSSDEEETSVMTTFANEADVTALSKDDDEVTYVSQKKLLIACREPLLLLRLRSGQEVNLLRLENVRLTTQPALVSIDVTQLTQVI